MVRTVGGANGGAMALGLDPHHRADASVKQARNSGPDTSVLPKPRQEQLLCAPWWCSSFPCIAWAGSNGVLI